MMIYYISDWCHFKWPFQSLSNGSKYLFNALIFSNQFFSDRWIRKRAWWETATSDAWSRNGRNSISLNNTKYQLSSLTFQFWLNKQVQFPVGFSVAGVWLVWAETYCIMWVSIRLEKHLIPVKRNLLCTPHEWTGEWSISFDFDERERHCVTVRHVMFGSIYFLLSYYLQSLVKWGHCDGEICCCYFCDGLLCGKSMCTRYEMLGYSACSVLMIIATASYAQPSRCIRRRALLSWGTGTSFLEKNVVWDLVSYWLVKRGSEMCRSFFVLPRVYENGFILSAAEVSFWRFWSATFTSLQLLVACFQSVIPWCWWVGSAAIPPCFTLRLPGENDHFYVVSFSGWSNRTTPYSKWSQSLELVVTTGTRTKDKMAFISRTRLSRTHQLACGQLTVNYDYRCGVSSTRSKQGSS
jgi:hypothetical protein